MKNIKIISSYAKDHIEYKNEISDGGPAYFIKKNLKNIGCKFEIISGEKPGKVKIYKGNKGEDIGKIEKAYKIEIKEKIENSIVLISTLEQEFNLDDLKKIENSTIFIDIQGFIREIGKKEKIIFKTNNYKNVNYIKATYEELKFIDEEIIEYIKNRKHGGLIITNGGGNIDFMSGGKTHKIEIKKGNFVDTIGAGDTFISSFIKYYEEGNNDIDSIKLSIDNTYEFLKNKNFKY